MARFRIAEGVLRATMQDQEVLLNPDTGQYHLLNPTGKFVVEEWERGRDTAQVVQQLVADSAEGDAVQADVDRFVEALTERGLIQPSA